MPIGDRVIVRTKAGLALHLMDEAWRLVSMCEQIEQNEKHLEWKQPGFDANLGHAAAAVIMAAAALEAAINETYLRAVDRNYSAFPRLDEPQVTSIANLWEAAEGARETPLEKHDRALREVGKTAISRGANPGQPAASLFKLRNLLVHFKPEWDNELDRHLDLENRLRDRFEPNRLSATAPGTMAWFPNHCLGAGCARWACETATAYHSEFVERLGIRPAFRDRKDR